MLQFENLKIEAVNKETFLIEEGFFMPVAFPFSN
jgi:hypothetical protein